MGIPGSLVVRIRRSHRRGRGSILRQGEFVFTILLYKHFEVIIGIPIHF